MELPELEAQLAALQAANRERDFNEGKRQFYDKFGTAFSNNDDIGLALLSRMAQNGVPMQNATMDVVQEVLAGMQQELNSYLSAIQINNAQAQDLIQKVQGMEAAITEVTGATPEQALMGEQAMPPAPPPEAAAQPPEAAPPTEGEMPPEAAPPPEEAAPPPEEAAPPATTPSDKRIKTILSDERLKNVKGEDRDVIEAILAKYDEEPIEDDAEKEAAEAVADRVAGEAGVDLDGDGLPDYSGDPDDEEEVDIGDDGLGGFMAAISRRSPGLIVEEKSEPIDPYDIKTMAKILASVQ